MKSKLVAFIFLAIFYGCEQSSQTVEVNPTDSAAEDFAIIAMDSSGGNSNELKGMMDSLSVPEESNPYSDACAGAFSIVLQKFSLKTEKEYLEKLNYLYESTSQQELESRRRSSVGINVPDYGTLDWGSNKAKVQRLYSKYKTQINYSLDYKEVLELNETYSKSEDVANALNAWNNCIRDTYKVPYLSYMTNEDSSILVSFEMQPNQFRGPNDKVKVTDIAFSSNLELLSGNFKKGGKIKYSGTYNLQFKRKDKKSGFVRVDLEEGKIISTEIRRIVDSPVYVSEVVKETYKFDVEIDVSANWMKFRAPNGSIQTIKFRDQSKNPYKLTFNVKTILKNPEAKIDDYFYSPVSGGLGDFKKKGVIIEPNGLLSVGCYLVTGAKKMKGKFTILYSSTKQVCKENCPDVP